MTFLNILYLITWACLAGTFYMNWKTFRILKRLKQNNPDELTSKSYSVEEIKKHLLGGKWED